MTQHDTTAEDTRAALDLLASALATTLPAFVVNGVANALEAIMRGTQDPGNIRAGRIAKLALQSAIVRAVRTKTPADYVPPFRPGAGGPAEYTPPFRPGAGGPKRGGR